MIFIRLESCKLTKSIKAETVLDDLSELNLLLSKSKTTKKRNEELLKKNFKTIINIMLEDAQDSVKNKKADYRAEFISTFFGQDQSNYS